MWSLDYVEVAVDSLGEDLDHVDTLTINTETDTVQVCQDHVRGHVTLVLPGVLHH